MFAIVDVETTGGKYNEEKITDIAIYKYDGEQIVDRFSSLVNPEKKIQDFVVKLTGITDKMVKRAPKFYELAKRIIEITEGCTFVAHNATFDYRMLRKEFKDLGYDYQRNTLCTVQLSQELIPGLESYSLGKICKSLGIPATNRHRADGDAFATVNLFQILLQKDRADTVINRTIKDSTEFIQKEKIKQVVDDIPSKTGVFCLHQQNGRVMYIGKATNMKRRISQLLAKNSKKIKRIQSKLARVTYEITGSYLMARLLFNEKVQLQKPRYNSNYFPESKPVELSYEHVLLIDKGRDTGENVALLIKEGKLQGYAYVNLAYQMFNEAVFSRLLTPLEDSMDNRYIVQTAIEKKRYLRLIQLP